MLQGSKTYITLAVQLLYNLGIEVGLNVPLENMEITVNVILACGALLFNYLGRRRLGDKPTLYINTK